MSPKKTRKLVSSEELWEILETVHTKCYERKENKGWSFDPDLAGPFLNRRGLSDHIVLFQFRPNPLNSEKHIYDTHNLILKNLNIELNCNLEWRQDSRWVSDSPFIKWHFERCEFRATSPNMHTIRFDWRGEFRFFGNIFEFGGSGGRTWLLVFAGGSSVLFQTNDFRESSIQIPHTPSNETLPKRKLSWGDTDAYIVEDESFYQAMIRRNYGLPDSVQLRVLREFSDPFVGGLDRISLIGNRGIDRLLFRCKASNYVFDGINNVNHLGFTEFDSDFDELKSIYFSSREQIDPFFHHVRHHRRLFLSLRKFGVKKHDNELVKALEKQLSRIEYFLTKERSAPIRLDCGDWLGYWQDRLLQAWRRWSADFYRSWSRPLTMVIVGYLTFNAAPVFWIDGFSISDWLTFSLRRIDKIPFFTAGLSEFHRELYDSLTLESKNWLRLVGLLQVVWVTMWGFAFSKAIRSN